LKSTHRLFRRRQFFHRRPPRTAIMSAPPNRATHHQNARSSARRASVPHRSRSAGGAAAVGMVAVLAIVAATVSPAGSSTELPDVLDRGAPNNRRLPETATEDAPHQPGVPVPIDYRSTTRPESCSPEPPADPAGHQLTAGAPSRALPGRRHALNPAGSFNSAFRSPLPATSGGPLSCKLA
jgi:hypothetical protein